MKVYQSKSSRSVDDLIPVVKDMALAHVKACANAGIDLLIYCTLRSDDDQNALYASGRTKPGKIVTYAKAGYSDHQFGIAYDCVPMRDGKPVWGRSSKEDKAIWQQVGALGKSVGLEWAGDWKRFKEFPHFKYRGGLTIRDLQAGKLPS